jgi:thiol-disulfide isomerase/thioredoxin
MKTIPYYFLIFCLLFNFQTFAQTSAKVDDFALPNLSDGTSFSLNQAKSSACVVLLITSAYCPYSKSYKERVIQLAKKYASQGVRFVLINPENEQDTEESMKSNSKDYNLPYLYDKGDVVCTKLQATKTPEVFVLQQNFDMFIVKYHGAIDDNPQSAEEVSKSFLEIAIKACLNKQNLEVSYQKPTGCLIKKQ